MLQADAYRRPPLSRRYTETVTALGQIWEHPSLPPGRYAVSVRPASSDPQPYIVEVRAYLGGEPQSHYVMPAVGDTAIADPGLHRAMVLADRLEVYLIAADELSAKTAAPAGETWYIDVVGPLAEVDQMDGIIHQGPALWYEATLVADGTIRPITPRPGRKVPVPPWTTGLAVAVMQDWSVSGSPGWGSVDIWAYERHDDGTGTPIRLGWAQLPTTVSGRWEYALFADSGGSGQAMVIPPGAFGRLAYSIDSGGINTGDTASLMVFPLARR